MANEPDFTLYDRYGRLTAVVEVKAKRGTSSAWAAEFRRNLLEYDAFRYAPFFLFVTPDRLYLWKDGHGNDAKADPVPPDYELDAYPLFAPYLEKTDLKLEQITSEAFELIVMSWLRDLMLQLRDIPSQAQLEDSGLSEAAKDGRITYPAAA
ncbi:MAG TPA: hypothetical protein VF789_28925 [Thermoanaerobaculia bacterium]